ncbi:alpha/beta fold hydrolase [Halalkalibacter akibai]|uniref:Hydrolase n=1 Tax=Halalkalibacter akibai (strain ATCC 43226 / DSM 21942 / CIP 109018 / JCM 9157 / 1139) TaxID=1236973 RepID=W4QNE1_HALA3|nr:alpha/beta hydrolase [Halalkalibacter akibai]GAE33596.1 hydrolase [Halalkalibacter akibai JCM 9157]
MPYLKNQKLHLYYEIIGTGTPIVFIHPPVMGSETFRYQKQLAENYQLIFIDLIDSGRSSKRVEETSVPDQAKMIHALVSELKLPPVILCGYSNGSSTAQEFALSYPEMTKGLILIGGFSEVSTFLLNQEFNLGILAAKNKMMNLLSFGLPVAHFRSKDHQREMAHFIKQSDGPTLQRIYEDGKRYKSTGRLKQIQVPVLLIYGKRDIITKPYAMKFFKELKDVDVILVDGVAHQVPTKRPDQCNTIIDEWIKRKKIN